MDSDEKLDLDCRLLSGWLHVLRPHELEQLELLHLQLHLEQVSQSASIRREIQRRDGRLFVRSTRKACVTSLIYLLP